MIVSQPLIEIKSIPDVTDFSCGSNYVIAVNKEKQLFGIGSNENGQLAHKESFVK